MLFRALELLGVVLCLCWCTQDADAGRARRGRRIFHVNYEPPQQHVVVATASAAHRLRELDVSSLPRVSFVFTWSREVETRFPFSQNCQGLVFPIITGPCFSDSYAYKKNM